MRSENGYVDNFDERRVDRDSTRSLSITYLLLVDNNGLSAWSSIQPQTEAYQMIFGISNITKEEEERESSRKQLNEIKRRSVSGVVTL